MSYNFKLSGSFGLTRQYRLSLDEELICIPLYICAETLHSILAFQFCQLDFIQLAAFFQAELLQQSESLLIVVYPIVIITAHSFITNLWQATNISADEVFALLHLLRDDLYR